VVAYRGVFSTRYRETRPGNINDASALRTVPTVHYVVIRRTVKAKLQLTFRSERLDDRVSLRTANVAARSANGAALRLFPNENSARLINNKFGSCTRVYVYVDRNRTDTSERIRYGSDTAFVYSSFVILEARIMLAIYARTNTGKRRTFDRPTRPGRRNQSFRFRKKTNNRPPLRGSFSAEGEERETSLGGFLSPCTTRRRFLFLISPLARRYRTVGSNNNVPVEMTLRNDPRDVYIYILVSFFLGGKTFRFV